MQEVTNFSINHLKTLVDNDIAESEENQNQVILAHGNSLSHSAPQSAWLNSKGEQNIENVVAQQAQHNPKDQPEGILKRRNEHLDVNHNQYRVKHVVSIQCEPSLLPICQNRIVKGNEHEQANDNTLPHSIGKPSPKRPLIEKDVKEANGVHLGIIQQNFFGVFPVENGKPDDGEGCEPHVVEI